MKTMSKNKEKNFTDQEIDCYVRQFIRTTPNFCKNHQLDIKLYYEVMIQGMRAGNARDRAIALKLARKLLDTKVLNWPN